GDDIEVFADDTRSAPVATLHALRQQMARENRRDRANTALADFIAPRESGLADYIGAFAVTAGIGEAEALARHIQSTDDYGPSCSRRLPTGSQRPSLSACMSARAASSGVTLRARSFPPGRSLRRSIAASVRRPDIPRSPTIPRKPPSSACSMP